MAYDIARSGGKGPPGKRVQNAPDDKLQMARYLCDAMEDRYQDRNRKMGEIRLHRTRRHPVDIPEGARATDKETRLPLIRDAIDLQSSIVNDAEPRFHVPQYAMGPNAERNSGLRERWNEAVVKELDKERKCLQSSTDNLVQDGLGVMKVVPRPDAWATMPGAQDLFGKPARELDEAERKQFGYDQERMKKSAPLPFSWVDVDPLTYFPEYGPDGQLRAVCEVREMAAFECVQTYGDRLGLDREGGIVPAVLGEPFPLGRFDVGGEDQRTRKKVRDYVDREWSFTFVEDVLVRATHHKWGRLNYFDALARPQSSRDPGDYAEPPMYKTIDIADWLDRAFTMLENLFHYYCHPTPFWKHGLGLEVSLGGDARPNTTEFRPHEWNHIYEGDEVGFFEPPSEHLQMMQEVIGTLVRIFETSTGLGPAIKGLAGSDASGYQVNQLIQASMLSLKPIVMARDAMVRSAFQFIWYLVERDLKDTVWVYGQNPDKDKGGQKWLGLGPRDIRGYYALDVDSEPLSEQRLIMMGNFYAEMKDKEMIDHAGAIEASGISEDPSTVIAKINVNKAMANGPLADLKIFYALKEAGVLPESWKPKMQNLENQLYGGLGLSQEGGGQPMLPPGLEGAPPTGPGTPPMPGQGLPLAPEPPPVPLPNPNQIAERGSIAGPNGSGGGMPGVPAGTPRPGPNIMPRPIRGPG